MVQYTISRPLWGMTFVGLLYCFYYLFILCRVALIDDDRWRFVAHIFASFLSYLGLYLWLDKGQIFDPWLLKYYPPERLQSLKIGWNSRVVSAVNALVTTYSGIRELWIDYHQLFDDPIWGFEPKHTVAYFGAILVGYCLFDLMLILVASRELGEASIIFHHIAIILWVITGCITKLFFGIGVWFFVNEISTIFLNLRWFFHKIQYSPTAKRQKRQVVPSWILYTNSLIFYITFFIIRVVFNLYISVWAVYLEFWVYKTQTTWVRLYVGGFVPALCVLNLFWFSIITFKGFQMFGYCKGKKDVKEGGETKKDK